MDFGFHNECDAYEFLLCHHFQGLIERFSLIPEDKIDWSPHIAAPTCRTLAVHAWQWLQCDRAHIVEPDPRKHSLLLEPAPSKEEFCEQMLLENGHWRKLLREMTEARLAESRFQFVESENPLSVRFFICHAIQNTIYKHGQLSELFFALELDGSELYSAPFPNKFYKELVHMK